MNDLATLTARPGELVAGDEAHPMAPLTLDDWGELQAWVDRQFPDPFDAVDAFLTRRAAAGRPVPPAQQQHLLTAAVEASGRPKRLVGTPEADEVLRSAEGMIETIFLGVRRAEPGFTRAAARAFYAKLSVVQLHKALMLAHADLILSAPPDPFATGTGPTVEPPAPGSTGGSSSTGA